VGGVVSPEPTTVTVVLHTAVAPALLVTVSV